MKNSYGMVPLFKVGLHISIYTVYYASSSTAQHQLSQSIVGTLSLLIWDLLGSNGEIEIGGYHN